MTSPSNRPKIRNETAHEVRAFAAKVRQTAGALEALYDSAQSLSDPLFLTGWTRPLSTVGGLAKELRGWADSLDVEADKAPDR